MTTVTIGKLVVDLTKVGSDEDRELLEQFGLDGDLTDGVVAALGRYSQEHKGAAADGSESKASKIRKMAAAGMTTGDISRALDIRFQFVYNVLNKPAKVAK